MSRQPRSKRSDGVANVERIRLAALDLLGRAADPTMAEIAAAAGLSRQTVYSHFPTRQSLYDDLVARLVDLTAEALGKELPAEPAAALRAWVDRAWQLVVAQPALLNPALFAGSSRSTGDDVMAEHEPLVGRLRTVLAEAARLDQLAPGASPDWLVAAVIALGHAAGQEVAAGRLGVGQAGDAFRSGVLRLCLRDGSAQTGARAP
jgi:AcrR family transcriptional regulator